MMMPLVPVLKLSVWMPVAIPVVSRLIVTKPPLPLLPSAELSNMLMPWGLVLSGVASVVE